MRCDRFKATQDRVMMRGETGDQAVAGRHASAHAQQHMIETGHTAARSNDAWRKHPSG